MINMLLNASVTGGIIILLWYLSCPLSQRCFKASWHYTVLKIAMVFMLFPVGVLAPGFGNILTGLFDKPELPYISEQVQVMNITPEKVNSVNAVLSDLVFPDFWYFPQTAADNISIEQPDNITPSIPYLQLSWLIVAIILFGGGICKMHKFKKQIINNTNSSVDRETLRLLLQCKEQLKVHGRIAVRTSEYIKTPLVFGLVRPCVILPETDMSMDEKRLAFIHELTHIKNGDLWLKFLAFVISTVHWFNPLVHLLRRKISIVSEEYCDERVVRTMTKEEKLLYGGLILKVISDIAAPQSKFCSTLSVSTKNIKRRLSNMINIKKSRKSMIALSIIFAFIMCSMASIYAFAANTNGQSTITVDNINSEEMPTDYDITSSSEPIYPIDLEYFKDWEGWEKEFEKDLESYKKRFENELKQSEKYEEYIKEYEEHLEYYKSPEYWNTSPWKKIDRNEGVMFKLKNGTEIETGGIFLTKQDWYGFDLTKTIASVKTSELAKYMLVELAEDMLEHLKSVISKSFIVENNIKPSKSSGNSVGLMIPMQKSIVRLANGIVIETPIGTLLTVYAASDADPKLEIIVGIGEATITQPDGAVATVPTSTVLDGEGNIIE